MPISMYNIMVSSPKLIQYFKVLNIPFLLCFVAVIFKRSGELLQHGTGTVKCWNDLVTNKKLLFVLYFIDYIKQQWLNWEILNTFLKFFLKISLMGECLWIHTQIWWVQLKNMYVTFVFSVIFKSILISGP